MRQNRFDIRSMFKSVDINKEEFYSNSPPSVFVGSKLKYPLVNVGILTPQERIEDAWLFDAENYWALENYSIKEIVHLRASLINSRFRANVYPTESNKFIDIAQEIGMAYKPVDVEIKLNKKLQIKLDLEHVTLPMGPRAQLKNVKITENPKIHSKVDKVVSDTDFKAVEAINYLYNNNFNEKVLSQLLSIGVLGLAKNRKLVPTKWSITSVDDIIAKNLLNDIRSYNEVSGHSLYFGNYLGNYYLLLFFPEAFSYELFEVYLPKSAWNETSVVKVATDYEAFYGRKTYAFDTAGGYYATRLPIVEYLHRIKKKASVMAIRIETPEYYLGLGVFVVRESVRKALENKSFIFDTEEEMLDYANNLMLKRFNYSIKELLSKSKILKNIKNQVKLTRFLKP